MLEQIGKQAKAAARRLAACTTEEKNRALLAMAESIERHREEILSANEKDMTAAREKGMNDTMLDRLQLTGERVKGMAAGLRDVAALPDPVGPSAAQRFAFGEGGSAHRRDRGDL